MNTRKLMVWSGIILILSPFLAYGIAGIIPGIGSFVVESGSMEPEIQTGALLFTVKTPAEKIEVGDTITYHDGDGFITHEAIEKEKGRDETFFRTQGVANQFPDPGRITEEQIAGKKAFSIPYAGQIIRNGLIALILIPATLIISSETVKIFKELRK